MKNRSISLEKFIYLVFVSLFLFLGAIPLYSQKTKNNQQFLVWQQRVDTLTDEIVKDSSSLSDSERAIYLALLSKIWWKINQQEAETYLKKASKLTINSLESDEKPDFAEKVKNTQKTIQIITGLDEKLSQNLLEQFIKTISEKAVNSEKNADMLILIALQIVEKKPQLAFTLGLKSLSFGSPIQIVRLIGELNAIDSKLAEQLFLATLINAKNNFNLRFVGRLSVSAFTEYKGKTLSDLARRSFLTMLAEMLARSVTNEQEKPSACQTAIIASPIIDKFEQYLPAQTQTIKWQIQMCQPYLPKTNASLVDADLKDDKPKTVEELISAARNTSDEVLKSEYFYQAMVKLEEEEKFIEILSLLDSMTEDEKKSFGNDSRGESILESSYAEYAFSAVLQFIKNKDLASAYRIIDRTPKRVRPSVRIRLAFKLSEIEDKPFILNNIEKAREESASIEVSAFRKVSYFLSLTYLYTKTQPIEAQVVFRETVKAINSADSENPDNVPEKDYAPLQDYISLPSELFEFNEIVIFNALNDIGSRRSRVRLKLGLLESSLKRYLSEKKKVELENEKRNK